MYSDEQVARVCHDANRALQYVHGDPAPSQPWDCETDEIRESVVEGVRAARRGCMSRELHGSWVKFKRERGWTYGPVKDSELKTHPCMLPYDELPQAQRDKDRVFRMIVRAMTDFVP